MLIQILVFLQKLQHYTLVQHLPPHFSEMVRDGQWTAAQKAHDNPHSTAERKLPASSRISFLVPTRPDVLTLLSQASSLYFKKLLEIVSFCNLYLCPTMTMLNATKLLERVLSNVKEKQLHVDSLRDLFSQLSTWEANMRSESSSSLKKFTRPELECSSEKYQL